MFIVIVTWITTIFAGDNEPLHAFYEKMKNEELMQRPKYEHPVILRGNLLVHAHVLRLTSHLSPVRQHLFDEHFGHLDFHAY